MSPGITVSHTYIWYAHVAVMLHTQLLCCTYSLCRCFEHTGVESACLADWNTLQSELQSLSVFCCKCRTILLYTDGVFFLVLQPWTGSLPPWTSRRHMESQLWHPHPSSALRALLQNLCPEGAQTAVFCQEEGQC